MKDEMYANPEKIVEKGENIKRLAKLCLEEIKSVSSESEAVKNAWEDSASNAYVSQIKEYVPKFESLQEQLNQIGDVLIRHGNRLIEDRDRLASMAEDL